MRRSDEFAHRVGVATELRPLVAAIQRFTAATTADSMGLWLQLDLTMPQFAALHIIWRAGRISGRQLAEQLGVSPPAVVKVCDRLEARGYVERIRDQVDRRVQWFQLTDRGSDVFRQLVALKRAHLAPALRELSSGDRQTLTRILNVIASTIEAARD